MSPADQCGSTLRVVLLWHVTLWHDAPRRLILLWHDAPRRLRSDTEQCNTVH